MPELRLNPVTRRWIVTGKRKLMPDGAEVDGKCPFCPGSERLTPRAIAEIRNGDGAWTTRVFHDRAPIFNLEEPLNSRGEGLYDHMNTLGAHEILVESPLHGARMSSLPVDQWREVIEVCRDRILDLKKDFRFRYVSLYKVQREATARWLNHSHSHILASPALPQVMQVEFRWCREHFLKKERCLFCDIIRQETHQDKRVVDLSQEFIAICPFASRSPYEVWILPVAHGSSFEQEVTIPGRSRALAGFFKDTLAKVENITASFTLVIHTEPNVGAHGWPEGYWSTISEDFHWHIEINPEIEGERRVLGSEGFYFNPIPAEEATLVLRALEPGAQEPE